jgi:orotate phosphoribosyltransferase
VFDQPYNRDLPAPGPTWDDVVASSSRARRPCRHVPLPSTTSTCTDRSPAPPPCRTPERPAVLDRTRDFIDLMVRCDVLTFGDFVASPGRRTPYFVNAGATGPAPRSPRSDASTPPRSTTPSATTSTCCSAPPTRASRSPSRPRSRWHRGPRPRRRLLLRPQGGQGPRRGRRAHRPPARRRRPGRHRRGRHHRRHLDPRDRPAAAGRRRTSTSSGSWSGSTAASAGPATDVSALDELADELGLRTVALATIDDIVEHLRDREVDGRRVLGDDDLARIAAYRAEHGVSRDRPSGIRGARPIGRPPRPPTRRPGLGVGAARPPAAASTPRPGDVRRGPARGRGPGAALHRRVRRRRCVGLAGWRVMDTTSVTAQALRRRPRDRRRPPFPRGRRTRCSPSSTPGGRARVHGHRARLGPPAHRRPPLLPARGLRGRQPPLPPEVRTGAEAARRGPGLVDRSRSRQGSRSAAAGVLGPGDRPTDDEQVRAVRDGRAGVAMRVWSSAEAPPAAPRASPAARRAPTAPRTAGRSVGAHTSPGRRRRRPASASAGPARAAGGAPIARSSSDIDVSTVTARTSPAVAEPADRGRHHRRPAAGVHGEQPHAEVGDARRRPLHGGRDVVQLEVEHHRAVGTDRLDRGGPWAVNSSRPTLNQPTSRPAAGERPRPRRGSGRRARR